MQVAGGSDTEGLQASMEGWAIFKPLSVALGDLLILGGCSGASAGKWQRALPQEGPLQCIPHPGHPHNFRWQRGPVVKELQRHVSHK